MTSLQSNLEEDGSHQSVYVQTMQGRSAKLHHYTGSPATCLLLALGKNSPTTKKPHLPH